MCYSFKFVVYANLLLHKEKCLCSWAYIGTLENQKNINILYNI